MDPRRDLRRQNSMSNWSPDASTSTKRDFVSSRLLAETFNVTNLGKWWMTSCDVFAKEKLAPNRITPKVCLGLVRVQAQFYHIFVLRNKIFEECLPRRNTRWRFRFRERHAWRWHVNLYSKQADWTRCQWGEEKENTRQLINVSRISAASARSSGLVLDCVLIITAFGLTLSTHMRCTWGQHDMHR